tara:strand:- start:740 stop:943 length:204 start_codon:yes stop_codon:yes gene_type:complete
MSAGITPEVELELDIYDLVETAHRVRRQIHRTSMEQRQELEGIGGLLMSLGATDTLLPQTNTEETAS